MNTVFKVLIAPIAPFVSHPERAFVVDALFAILLAVSLVRARTLKLRHLVMLFAMLAWGLFGMNEIQAQQKGWDIRVDLFVLSPIVFALSIAAAWAEFRSGSGRVVKAQNAEKSPD